MTDYGKFRYNLLGNAADWFPGNNAGPDRLDPVKPRLEALFSKLPAGPGLMKILEETHELLAEKEQKRLSESE